MILKCSFEELTYLLVCYETIQTCIEHLMAIATTNTVLKTLGNTTSTS